MEYIWAPWRIQYIQMEKPQGCFLCDKPLENDDETNYILYRGEKNYIILNSFPYNPGHMLVTPYRHVAAPDKMTKKERQEHFEIVSQAIAVLRAEFKPGGFNIGANLGHVAGAGVADHFHTHIVPRWQGDANAMPVISDTKIIPEALAETYRKLKKRF
ncbi:MAG: HIT domain-containing protein [Dehalococcoidales bacterium]|nr:HIT domain-containing protein [Dehalococcoidales bacterium]